MPKWKQSISKMKRNGDVGKSEWGRTERGVEDISRCIIIVFKIVHIRIYCRTGELTALFNWMNEAGSGQHKIRKIIH